MGEGQNCFRCDKPGHFARECPERPKDQKDRPRRVPSDRDSILRPPVAGIETGVKLSMVRGRYYRTPQRIVNTRVEEEEFTMSDLDIRFDEITSQHVLHLREIRPEFYKFIVGAKKSMLSQLETETGCSISIPKTKKEEEEVGIVVRGLREQSVIDAKTQIDYIVERSREKIPFTHFVSIPLDTSSIMPETKKLLGGIVEKFAGAGSDIEPGMVQRAEKVHLTVAMLRIYNEEDRTKAINTLRKCEGVLKKLFTAQDKIHLRGLDCMNNDTSKVHVGYICVEENASLPKLLECVQEVANAFVMEGLCTSRDVKGNAVLHATILNSKWRKGKAEDGEESDGSDPEDLRKSNAAQMTTRVPFDYGPVLDEYGDVDLGEHKLLRMEVSQLQARGETGYFDALASVSFP
eukprot:TRINITY_DN9494_c0_g1_i1.p1 TRINITY_DN9494_c0_g1~~TRINITY_DN9494_c0_g1_i1.p1  ORF type:complete len:405 (+),score=153.25 TRINITY_DN9494_c0_g1_i1:76-1290(+)